MTYIFLQSATARRMNAQRKSHSRRVSGINLNPLPDAFAVRFELSEFSSLKLATDVVFEAGVAFFVTALDLDATRVPPDTVVEPMTDPVVFAVPDATVLLTVKNIGFEYPPAGAGLNMFIRYFPDTLVSAGVSSMISFVGLTYVVVRAEPLNRATEEGTNPEPVRVMFFAPSFLAAEFELKE